MTCLLPYVKLQAGSSMNLWSFKQRIVNGPLAGNAGNVFPATAGKRSRHASWHVRDARAVMYAGIVE